MFCCEKCFSDPFLSDDIPAMSELFGHDHFRTCSYCNSEQQFCVPPSALQSYFEQLIAVYKEDPSGDFLVEWLKKDWAMFVNPSMDLARAKSLLADILDDGEIVRKRFVPTNDSESDALVKWNDLRSELKHSNRYFPKTEINKNRLRELFDFLIFRDGQIGRTWFRARVQEGAELIPPDKMLAPPKEIVSHGRANPAGIPYLYIASNALTAIAEVRPHTGDQITVAEVLVDDNLHLADLRHPKITVSPIPLQDETQIAMLRTDISFLEKLGDELKRPVSKRASAYEYVPSQYLCELIKDFGFDGVVYSSSVGDGVNLALFYPEKATIQSVMPHIVRRVIVELE